MTTVHRPEIHTLPPEGLVLKGEVEILAPQRAAPSRRWFHPALAVAMTVVVTFGFARWLLSETAHRGLSGAWLDEAYAIVLGGWMILFMTQTALVFSHRTEVHRKLGMFGVGFGISFVLMGLAATLLAAVLHVQLGDWTQTQGAAFLLMPLGDLFLFAALFAASIAYRHNKRVHKRLMLLATSALLFAPVAHLTGDAVWPLVVIVLLPAILAAIYDIVLHHYIHPANLAGIAVLLLGCARVLVMHREEWLHIGRAIISMLVSTPG